ncbi:hypothetical protein KDA_75570 [Dictyobacter alpinus]|uniref:Uncharacterized protein n=1 Tax=Dictyobacter alpinus TaxID=2014873 RepID=A0A402BL30_9CHLR|nr:hypothetical protein KDA_75570 [Dictyobacter alpinus]
MRIAGMITHKNHPYATILIIIPCSVGLLEPLYKNLNVYTLTQTNPCATIRIEPVGSLETVNVRIDPVSILQILRKLSDKKIERRLELQFQTPSM